MISSRKPCISRSKTGGVHEWWEKKLTWLREAARLMGAGKETSKETALEAERTGFQSQQLHMMTIYEWTRVIYLELFRYWLFIHTYTIIYMSRLMMLMLDCQHVDCYMIYRIARYFDQLGFLGAAPCLEVELFLACLVLVWIPGPWEGVLWSNQIFSHGMVVSDSLSHFVLAFLFMRNKLK